MSREDEERLVAARKTSEYEFGASKYIYTPLSRAFTRILMRTPATPNQITVFWGLLMIASSLAFLSGDRLLSVLGGIGWVVAYSLDYSDGDVARLKDMRSKRGPFQDLINHRTTYPLLMFCVGYGMFSTGRTQLLWVGVDPVWYLFLGFLAGLGMILIMDLGDAYNRVYPEGAIDSDRGSGAVEGSGVRKGWVRKLMGLNPLLFTNMMVLLPIFAALDIMEVFIILYGVGYPVAAFGRYVMLYRRLPGVGSVRSQVHPHAEDGAGVSYVAVDVDVVPGDALEEPGRIRGAPALVPQDLRGVVQAGREDLGQVVERVDLVLHRHPEVHDHAAPGPVDHRGRVPLGGGPADGDVIVHPVAADAVRVLREVDAQRPRVVVVYLPRHAEGAGIVVEVLVRLALDPREQLRVPGHLRDVAGTGRDVLPEAPGHVDDRPSGPQPFEERTVRGPVVQQVRQGAGGEQYGHGVPVGRLH